MVCPLCSTRKGRRACPALGRQICALCCGTKRIVEIQCPADCPYLAASREHPAAAVARQQEQDATFLVQLMRGLNQRQAQLFVGLNRAALRYEPPDFHHLLDEDVAEAAGAMAATLETRSRGVIYDHRPASLPAGRLMAALQPLVAEGARVGGSTFEREGAVVLRLIAKAVEETRSAHPAETRAYLDLVGRVIGTTTNSATAEGDAADPPRLILP